MMAPVLPSRRTSTAIAMPAPAAALRDGLDSDDGDALDDGLDSDEGDVLKVATRFSKNAHCLDHARKGHTCSCCR